MCISALALTALVSVGYAQNPAPDPAAGQGRGGGRGGGQQAPPGPREVPARTIPIPDTVSPEMQALIGRGANLGAVPKTDEEFLGRAGRGGGAPGGIPPNQNTLDQMGVKAEAMTVNGIPGY